MDSKKQGALRRSESRDNQFINPLGTILLAGIGVAASFATGGASLVMLAGGMAAFYGWRSLKVDVAAAVVKKNKKNLLPPGHPVARMVERLANEAGLKTVPRVIMVQDDKFEAEGVPYAGTLGTTDSSAILVSKNIEQQMTPSELNAVLAHEITHIQNADTKIGLLQANVAQISFMSVAFVFVSSLMAMAVPGFPVPGIAATLLGGAGIVGTMATQAAISRARERRADLGGARLSKNPWALASALNRIIELQLGSPKMQNSVKPTGLKALMVRLFRSHPQTKLRREALLELGEEMIAENPAMEAVKKRTEAELKIFDGLKQARKTFGPRSSTGGNNFDGHNFSNFCEAPWQKEKLPFNKAAKEQDNDPAKDFDKAACAPETKLAAIGNAGWNKPGPR